MQLRPFDNSLLIWIFFEEIDMKNKESNLCLFDKSWTHMSSTDKLNLERRKSAIAWEEVTWYIKITTCISTGTSFTFFIECILTKGWKSTSPQYLWERFNLGLVKQHLNDIVVEICSTVLHFVIFHIDIKWVAVKIKSTETDILKVSLLRVILEILSLFYGIRQWMINPHNFGMFLRGVCTLFVNTDALIQKMYEHTHPRELLSVKWRSFIPSLFLIKSGQGKWYMLMVGRLHFHFRFHLHSVNLHSVTFDKIVEGR